jgi:hypothetical protein
VIAHAFPAPAPGSPPVASLADIRTGLPHTEEDGRLLVRLGSKCRKCQTAVSNCIDLGQLLHEGGVPTHLAQRVY